MTWKVGEDLVRSEMGSSRHNSQRREGPVFEDSETYAALRIATSGQVPTTGGVAHVDLDADAGSSTNERMRSGTRRAPRPSRTRLVARSATRGPSMEVDLVGGSRGERLVRTIGVVPVPPERQLRDEVGAAERNEHETSRALALQGAHQPLDDRDAAVLADGTEAVLDAAAAAPALEALRGELRCPGR